MEAIDADATAKEALTVGPDGVGCEGVLDGPTGEAVADWPQPVRRLPAVAARVARMAWRRVRSRGVSECWARLFFIGMIVARCLDSMLNTVFHVEHFGLVR